MNTQTRTRTESRFTAILLAAIAAGTLLVQSASASTVLYDTLDMVGNGTYDASIDSYIGGDAIFGQPMDNQAADDFTLNGTYNITSVTSAFLANGGSLPFDSPSDGVLVEFFADVDGSPSETAYAGAFSSTVGFNPFADTNFGQDAAYITVDLSGADIVLGTGTWWMSIQPVNESQTGGPRWLWIQRSDTLSGNAVHIRNGGEAHGNGYNGTFPMNNWFSTDFLPFGSGDVAMQIQGTLVPAPAAVALLGVGGLFVRRRRR